MFQIMINPAFVEIVVWFHSVGILNTYVFSTGDVCCARHEKLAPKRLDDIGLDQERQPLDRLW